MIVRPAGSALILLTQPDHAALAARVMRQWRTNGLPDSPRRSSILLAIAEHDNGWREVDSAPVVEPGANRILDFVSAPDHVRRSVWPRGVARLADTPYAAALVAQHAIHIYRRYRADLEWTPFFAEMEAARDQHLDAAAPLSLNDLLADYLFVRMGDLASLTFCNGWTEPQADEFGHAIRFDGERLVITPDPFAGASVPLEISGREIPNGPFHSPADVYAAFAAARRVTLRGIASGT
jgi:hypothetical protein